MGVVSAVLVTCVWAGRCLVAEAVEKLAAQGALRVFGEERDAEAVLPSRSKEIRSQSKKREAGPSTNQMQFDGDLVPLSGLLHQSVQCVRVTQVGEGGSP